MNAANTPWIPVEPGIKGVRYSGSYHHRRDWSVGILEVYTCIWLFTFQSQYIFINIKQPNTNFINLHWSVSVYLLVHRTLWIHTDLQQHSCKLPFNSSFNASKMWWVPSTVESVLFLPTSRSYRRQSHPVTVGLTVSTVPPVHVPLVHYKTKLLSVWWAFCEIHILLGVSFLHWNELAVEGGSHGKCHHTKLNLNDFKTMTREVLFLVL